MIDLTGMKELSIGGVNLRELSIGGVNVWRAGRLPAGHTELQYIEATGTQYIDTGITGQDGLSVEFDFEALGKLSADNSTIIGSTNAKSDRMYLTLNKSSQTVPFLWEMGAKSYHVEQNYSLSHCALNTKYHINISWTKAASVLTVNDVTPITMNNTLTFDDNGSNMYIFARNKGTSVDKYSHARVWGDFYMLVNGVLVRAFVPDRYKDGTVGLYDLVTGSLFTNAGTGSFIAGPAV